MTDLDKKVKAVVDVVMEEFDGAEWGKSDLLTFATRIQSLCQQDAQRREVEALQIIGAVEHFTRNNPGQLLSQVIVDRIIAFRSREGQEGDKT